MKIKELSNLLNVSQKTIRYYEGCGFIMPLTQNKSGRIFRDYDEAAITQLKTIIGLRKLRFSIDEIFDNISSEKEGAGYAKKVIIRLLKNGKFIKTFYFMMQCGFRLFGYKLGKNYEKLPKKMVLACTMNKEYWK